MVPIYVDFASKFRSDKSKGLINLGGNLNSLPPFLLRKRDKGRTKRNIGNRVEFQYLMLSIFNPEPSTKLIKDLREYLLK